MTTSNGETANGNHHVPFNRSQSEDPNSSSSEALHSFRRHDSETILTSPRRRRGSLRYDASHAMDRVRSTFLADADYQSPLSIPVLSASTTFSSDDPGESAGYRDEEKPSLRTRKSIRTPNLDHTTTETEQGNNWGKSIQDGLGQIPAVVLISLFHLMIGIPFGVSYFPVGWRSESELEFATNSTASSGASDEFVHGPFPLPGKEALGIRMFLYATIIAQLVFAWKSDFHAIGLEMVENVPFYHELAATAIRHCGYGIDALVTLFFMFGLASVLVGVVFYGLGKYELGRIVYFFPMHVLVGCIGGIGLYIARTGLEVGMDKALTLENFMEHWDLLRVTFLFEAILRVLERVTLDADGRPRYALLSPIYFCSITPIFYLGLLILNVPIQHARDDGYFFPEVETAAATGNSTGTGGLWESVLLDEGIFDMWRYLDIRIVSWAAIFESIPTLVALCLFSLIHVPINIPALGISSNTDVDMNNELVAHGYSNFISGICGCGLQNYLAYTQSVVYYRSGGRGKRSGVAVAIATTVLFVIGPKIATFIPRAMAGSLLLHVGIDLFLEGVYDSFNKFDNLEYLGIWLIVIVMSLFGMEAAMVAGVIAAVSTYAMQSIQYLKPIRGSMSAVTLRSSHRNRNYRATSVLDDPLNGRTRILVIQLQGHLFFGNMAQLNTGIHKLLNDTHNDSSRRRIVIMDFSLVVGIDSSAAQGLIKLKNVMQKKHYVDVCVFVTGSEVGFPCEFDLSKELTSSPGEHHKQHSPDKKQPKKLAKRGGDTSLESISEATSLLHASSGSSNNLVLLDEEHQKMMDFYGSFVLQSLDLALVFSENVLIAWEDPSLLDELDRVGVVDHFNPNPSQKEQSANPPSLITDAMFNSSQSATTFLDEEEEKEAAQKYLRNMRPDPSFRKKDLVVLLSYFKRETYQKGEYLWKQNDASDCAKLVVSGLLMAMLENEAGTSEVVFASNLIGELGLVQGISRMSSVQCISDDGALLFSLSREAYEDLVKSQPHLARFVDLVCIQNLANRVQHVSNRIFETRCLPI